MIFLKLLKGYDTSLDMSTFQNREILEADIKENRILLLEVNN